MKQGTLFIGIIIILVALNFATLLYILSTNKQEDAGPKKFDKMIKQQLNLDAGQISKFEELKFEHHSQMVALDQQVIKPFENYFMLLKEDNPSAAAKDSLENILLDLHKSRIRLTYDHFTKLKAICSPSQKIEFEKLVPQFLRVMAPHNEGPGGRR